MTTTTTPSSRTDTAAVEIRGLVKKFGGTTALDGLDLTVARGSVTGFLGPNGAGKSTTIRVLLGLLRADGGTARLLGRDPWRDAVDLHRRIAYVPGDVTLWPNLTGAQAIEFLCGLRGGADHRRRDGLIERFELDPHRKARTYSKGNRQKVALVAAFASDADIYILDEPTSGLDPLMEKAFQQCVTEVCRRGAAVLLSSHILAETEALCDRLTIIRAGATVETGTLASLRHLSRTFITAELMRDPGDLHRIPGVEDIHYDGAVLHAQVDSRALGELIRVLGQVGVRSLESRPPTLEDLFLRHYGTEAVHA